MVDDYTSRFGFYKSVNPVISYKTKNVIHKGFSKLINKLITL